MFCLGKYCHSFYIITATVERGDKTKIEDLYEIGGCPQSDIANESPTSQNLDSR